MPTINELFANKKFKAASPKAKQAFIMKLGKEGRLEDSDRKIPPTEILKRIVSGSLPVAGSALRAIEKPQESIEALPSALAVAGGLLVPPVGAIAGGAAGKALEIGAKRIVGSEATTQPQLFGKPLPRIPKVPSAVSDVAVEGGTTGALEIPGILGKGLTGATQAFKALGFSKIKDPKIRGEALKASKTALDMGIVSPFASPKKMIERTLELKTAVGERIGNYLNKLGGGFDLGIAINNLEKLRPQRGGKFLSKGEWEPIQKSITKAVETVKEYAKSGRVATWEEANKLKGFQDLANYKVNSKATVLDQKIAHAFTSALDTAIDVTAKAAKKGGKVINFMKDKALYKDLSLIDNALNDRIGKDLAQETVKLTDAILLSQLLAHPGASIGIGWAAYRALKPKLNQILAVSTKHVKKIPTALRLLPR